MRDGIGGYAVDLRIFAVLRSGGFTENPAPELGVRYPDNFRDAKLLEAALRRAQTADLPPPAPADANGNYNDLISFSGEDLGLGTYAYLAFAAFGVTIPALTYLYFAVVTISLLLFGIGHGRSIGAMAAVAAMTLALYVVVCADFVNFLGSSKFFSGAGIDVKDPRFLGTIAAIPVLHLIVVWTRARYRLGALDYVVVVMQAAIFAFALQIRSPVGWSILALSVFWLVGGALVLRRGRSPRSLCDWRQSRSAPMPIAVVVVLLSAQLLAAVTLHPVYRAQGDVPRHMFWQGLLSSLQIEPKWDEKYGASVNNATGDAMPAETARIAIMKLPPEQRRPYLNGDGSTKRTALEKFSRIAFFDILRSDPRFVAHAFFIDKPVAAWRSEWRFFGGLFAGLPIWNVLVPAAAVLFLVFLVAVEVEAFRDAAADRRRDAVIYRPSRGCRIGWWWENPLVMIDNFVWIVVFCCCRW